MSGHRAGIMSKLVLAIALVVSLVASFGANGIVSAEKATSPIQVDMEHIILSISGDQVNVLHIVNGKNTSDKEFAGTPAEQGNAVFQADLPKGASNLKVMVEDQKTVVKKETGFYTTTPIGANQPVSVTYSYTLPQTSGHFLLSLKRPHDIQNLNILIPQGQADLKVESRQMTNNGAMDFQGKAYQVYSTDRITAGQQLDMIVLPGKSGAGTAAAAAGSEQAQTSGSTVTRKAPEFHNPGHLRMWYQSPLKEFNPHILLAVLSAILIFGVSFFSYRKIKEQKLRKSVFSSDEEALFQQLLLTQKVILNKIVEVEEAYDRAELSDDEYQERRDAYKNRLIDVKLKLQDLV